ncbi:sensor histidine kinase [Streptomyces sp. TRM66268-LWL]|uniref:histidine kinase n=1 Tax=Streptomyces polyasparticus TaxID=2767826 RepID=A0ABR7SS90_9ACTN|nr:histidine kinase [Streptomyces polyasparticus]MBC9718370.1 sensor histidine kinase [Streptomyces polyasparticus]
MTRTSWLRWPARESLTRERLGRQRLLLAWCGRVAIAGFVLWNVISEPASPTWASAVDVVVLLVCAGVWQLYLRTTLDHVLGPSLALLAVLVGGAIGAQAAGMETVGMGVWCAAIVLALKRLPLAVALGSAVLAYGGFVPVSESSWTRTLLTAATFCLVGYVLRLDAEGRGRERQLIEQERAALAAEAESAALTERARIAREIHDVLAHSLSAQLVHLEAARLLVERDAPKEQVLARVVAARGMAREGLAETRQALSALRGDMAPVEHFLRALDDVEVEVTGTPRLLSAEASQTVRRVAQEALTNVRKHAPGASVRLRFSYEEGEAALEVRDFGGARPDGELAATGSGYGLRGMRERAELLGGSLEAGPVEGGGGGFVVRLRVPE